MPKTIAYYKDEIMNVSNYSTLYDAFRKADLEVRYNGAYKCEVIDKHGDCVHTVWAMREDEIE